MALGSTQPLTEVSTRSISWGKGGRCVRLTTYHHPVLLSRNLGTFNSWNPLGHSRPVTGLLDLVRSYRCFEDNSASRFRINQFRHLQWNTWHWRAFDKYLLVYAALTTFAVEKEKLLIILRLCIFALLICQAKPMRQIIFSDVACLALFF